MKNGQSAALSLSNDQLQVILTGKFGDGCLETPKDSNNESKYSTNCIYAEYLQFKKDLLGKLCTGSINYVEKNGFKEKPIYTLVSHRHPDITYIKNLDVESSLNLLDDLGVALWFYDDGSLHKDKLFYNLNTQKYSEEINRDLFVPYLKENYNIIAKPTIERKKDGREFWYLRISKFEGAYEISEILNKYPVESYRYKIWSSETSQLWRKLQEELKSTNMENCSNKMKSCILKKLEQTM